MLTNPAPRARRSIAPLVGCIVTGALLVAACTRRGEPAAALPPTDIAPAAAIATSSMDYPKPVEADCPRLLAKAPPAGDGSALAARLAAIDPDHAAQLQARLPQVFSAWLGKAPPTFLSLGTAVHETHHVLDAALSELCHADGRARFFLAGETLESGLRFGTTANYSIAGEAVPAALQKGDRYATYIGNAIISNSNDFHVLLDEFAAYAGAARFESRLLSSPESRDWRPDRPMDSNLAGLVEFMLYAESYLIAAHQHHPPTEKALRNDAQTLAVLQRLWSTAEAILIDAWPQTLAADPASGVMVVPIETLEAVYAAPPLAALDALGIRHRARQDWAATYLKPPAR